MKVKAFILFLFFSYASFLSAAGLITSVPYHHCEEETLTDNYRIEWVVTGVTPAAPVGALSLYSAEIAAVHFQVRAAPTAGNPNPPWSTRKTWPGRISGQYVIPNTYHGAQVRIIVEFTDSTPTIEDPPYTMPAARACSCQEVGWEHSFHFFSPTFDP